MTFGWWLISCAAGAALIAGCGTSGDRETFPTGASTPAISTSNVDADRAQIIAAAVARVTMIDNTFGGSKPPSVVRVVEHFDADRSRPLNANDRAAVVDALRGNAEVIFVADVRSLIGDDPMNAPRGLFIVTVGEPTISGDSSEIRTSMWCGSLCATARTYRANRQQSGWRITATVGQIVVS